MSLVEPAMLTLVAVGAAWMVWQLWRTRQAEIARAEHNAELAQLTRQMDGIAHDLTHLMSGISNNLALATVLKPEELQLMISDMERAANSASKLVEAARTSAVPIPSRRSIEGIVRLAVALHRKQGLRIELCVQGDFTHRGTDGDALRVLQNLLANAAREAESGGLVEVSLDREALRITNPLRSGVTLPANLYERGVSGSGGSGVGLWIARELAERVGCTLDHVVGEGVVTFVLTPRPDGYRT